MYMDRKTRIMEIISSSDKPVSASKIAKELGVSRQIIVGDVALLRASGEDITATLAELDQISTKYHVNFVLSVSMDGEELPESAKDMVLVAL